MALEVNNQSIETYVKWFDVKDLTAELYMQNPSGFIFKTRNGKIMALTESSVKHWVIKDLPRNKYAITHFAYLV